MEKEGLKKKFKDPFTEEIFIQKRTNQVFANRSNQVKFNNEKAKKIRQQKSATEKVLHKNLKIILNLLGDKKEIIKSIEYLRGAVRFFVFYSFYRSRRKSSKNSVWT